MVPHVRAIVASTEPPIEIGGGPSARRNAQPLSLALQRSRRSRSAEGHRLARGVDKERRASTEPPIEIGGGPRHASHRRSRWTHASTEPPIEIGGGRARRARVVVEHAARDRFNGAADRDRRRVKSVVNTYTAMVTLQRSRRSRSAEGRFSGSASGGSGSLQRSRRSRSAEGDDDFIVRL